jgi:hypothetical protein
MKTRPSGEQQTTEGALMVGVWTMTSERQPGAHLSSGPPFVPPANTPNANDVKNAEYVKSFIKYNSSSA